MTFTDNFSTKYNTCSNLYLPPYNIPYVTVILLFLVHTFILLFSLSDLDNYSILPSFSTLILRLPPLSFQYISFLKSYILYYPFVSLFILVLSSLLFYLIYFTFYLLLTNNSLFTTFKDFR